MKVLLTSDLHIKKGIFVDIGLEYLDYISQYCRNEKIKTIYFLGDIFEKSSKIYNEAFVPLIKKFHQMSKEFALWFILGNHDIYSADKSNSIVEAFRPFGKVIVDGCTHDKYDLLPYTKIENEIPTETSVPYLFTHLAIANFQFDNNYHVNEKIAFNPDLFLHWKLVFTGHFHKHQCRKNIVYIGSPYQLSFNEVDTKKGFIVLDVDGEEWEFIEYNGAPEFLKITIDDIKKLEEFDFKNKFVKIKIDKKIDEFLKLKHILYEKGALDIVPDFQSVAEEIEAQDGGETIDFTMNIANIVKDYISSIGNENIDNKKLLKIFDNVLKEN